MPETSKDPVAPKPRSKRKADRAADRAKHCNEDNARARNELKKGNDADSRAHEIIRLDLRYDKPQVGLVAGHYRAGAVAVKKGEENDFEEMERATAEYY